MPNKFLKRLPNFVEKYYFFQNYQMLNIDNKIFSLPVRRYMLQSLKRK